MKLFKTKKGILLNTDDSFYVIEASWDDLVNRNGLHAYLAQLAAQGIRKIPVDEADKWLGEGIEAPIGSQEVWAAGVTYLRSRNARMEESKDSGGATFYDKVYEAERPELFFKSLPHRVSAHGEKVNIRQDSTWNVPEPELTLFISSSGDIQGYTIGNDMSSRSIEGENPLYLPQAKVYERSAALGPCLYVPSAPISRETVIHMTITRGSVQEYKGEVPVSQMKRALEELAAWLFRETDFAVGAYLMTGTCLVPPNEFTLAEGDRVDIAIDGIGVLTNHIAYKSR